MGIFERDVPGVENAGTQVISSNSPLNTSGNGSEQERTARIIGYFHNLSTHPRKHADYGLISPVTTTFHFKVIIVI